MKKHYFIYLLLTTLLSCETQLSFDHKNSLLENKKQQAHQFLNKKDSVNFFKTNREFLLLANQHQDSLAQMDAYWSYAKYYNTIEQNDSAFKYFIKSSSYNLKFEEHSKLAKQYYDIAVIKNRIGDYNSAEHYSYQSLSYNNSTNKAIEILCRNLLGVIFKNTSDYQESIKQFELAQAIIDETDSNQHLSATINNNLGLLYQNLQQYDVALDYFNRIPEISKNDPELKASLISNINYTKFLNGDQSSKVEQGLLKALDFRKAIDAKFGISDSYVQLTNFYLKTGAVAKATEYAYKLIKYTNKIHDPENKLKAYLLVADLEPKRADDYFKASNQLRDSLEQLDRIIRNKFTRIEYETNRYKEQSTQLAQTNTYLIVLAVLMSIVLILISNIITEKNKQKQLVLLNEIEADKSELLQLLTHLQININEGKNKERSRISSELQTGVLGTIASLRISLEELKKKAQKQSNITVPYQEYESTLSKLESDIRFISHGLSMNFDDAVNLNDIISAYLDSFRDSIAMSIEIHDQSKIDWENFSEFAKQNILRIIQEYFRSLIKHSKATKFKLCYKDDDKRFILEITNDGEELNYKKTTKEIGIKNVNKRVQLLKGSYRIYSHLKETIITIDIPKTSLYEQL